MTSKKEWTMATTNPNEAMLGLVSCLQYGYHAWIEVQKNGEQRYPVTVKNPALDDPFNWEAMYGTLRNKQELETVNFFNETEKDLTYNWIQAFGTKEAVEEYERSGIIIEGLINSMGNAHPVRIKDADWYRKHITGDGYEYGAWMYRWKPKKEIPFYIIDANVTNAFVVCYDEGPVNKVQALREGAGFLMAYADYLAADEQKRKVVE